MTQFNVQEIFWELINSMGQWIWYIKAISAFLCFLLMFFTPWKINRWILAMRYVSMLGMMVIGYSLFNTAFGPLGDLIFWPSFAIYKAQTLWLQLPSLRAEMRAQPPMPEVAIMKFLAGRPPVSLRAVKRD